MADENRSREDRGNDGRLARHTAYGAAAGIALGTVAFAVTENPIWIALGVALGAPLGAAFSSASDD